ncbi:transposase [Streptomyces sp. NPDC053367]|uniref:transposase n=1 Tax=Streptomyces sp. NPDC053367 TaxID=3365700 RepID=UPI0037CE8355
MSLTDAHWARIEALLPDRTPKRGGQWRDYRQVIDAIAFKYRTATQVRVACGLRVHRQWRSLLCV